MPLSFPARSIAVGPGRRLVGIALSVALVASACSDESKPAASSSTSPPAPSATAGTGGGQTQPSASGARAVVTVRMAVVGDAGNPSVGVTSVFGESGDFTDTANGGIFRSCDAAPPGPTNCITSGAVDYGFDIGELEVTVDQYVAFLNTVDPGGTNPHQLYLDYMSPAVWPKYGSISYESDAQASQHYAVASPEWADKPFGFADFLRSARFANSLTNGDVLSRTASSEGGFDYVTYEVRLSAESERGMYDLAKPDTTRIADTGFVVPSYDEWMKAAYFDPDGGGTFSYWQYPTGPTDAPNVSKLDPKTGDVLNAADQPLSTYNPDFPHSKPGTYPTWCPASASKAGCDSANPLNLPAGLDYRAWEGNLSTVGQTKTPSPWGTKDMGGNVVEWQDTIVEPPAGFTGKLPGDRVWRRMHGGVANAPAYQLLISAIGFQPQDQVLLDGVYPWFGFRVGVVGDLS